MDSRSPIEEINSTKVVQHATYSPVLEPQASPDSSTQKYLSGISRGSRPLRAQEFEW
ncbi:hypothetical protein CRG98_029020 [Punica granatum]|uniref:Uncharacterized protein n=1 Tax=Punica granatum TaxID=22663 RepID=A0A2I0J3Q7_PUNGR|nr:hypothetical protein CRG98_029020 [Punica granatum]